jgi:hypothetical protein
MTNIIRSAAFGGKSQIGDSTKTKTDTTTVANIEINDSQINGGNGGVKIVGVENHNYPPGIKPKRQKVDKRQPLTVEQGGITSGNKAIMKFLIDRWVELKKIGGATSNLYPHIRNRTYERATSAGIKGVSNIDEFPDCDFRKAETFLNSQIVMVIKSSVAVQEHVKEENRLKSEIQDRFKQFGTSEQVRRNYQMHHHGFASLKYFNMENLKKIHNAIMQPNPDLNVDVDYFENEELPQAYSYPKMQKQREKAISEWLTEQQANNPMLDTNCLPYTQKEMLEILQAKYPDLFKLSTSSFGKVWGSQKLCKLKPSAV